MQKLKILCIGDSLSLPGHLNSYEDTWFYKLKMEFPDKDFISYFKRQLTTEVLVTLGGGVGGVDNWPKGADCLEAYKPNLVIMQLGIVDCAPRLLNRTERLIAKILPPILRQPFINVLKKIKKRNINNTFVSFAQFKSYLDAYIKRAEKLVQRIIIIPISIPDSTFLIKNPQALLNINNYNDYYFELAKAHEIVICINELDSSKFEESVYQDGYHPNAIGHAYIFNELKKVVRVIS